jgi:hypothetical protein
VKGGVTLCLVLAPALVDAQGTERTRLSERARQDREIVYFLQPPETHAFDLYHDYTETRPGVDAYYNVVRKGSTASKPTARILDTGEALRVEIVKGQALLEAKVDVGDALASDSDVVVIRFKPVAKGASVRLRISETYTDPGRYGLVGGELVWDRTLGRPRNTVVLPAGFTLTACSVPAVVSQTEDGRTRLDLENARPDELAVLIKARRRTPPPVSGPR